MKLKTLLALLAAFALVVAACSSDDDADDDAGEDSSASETTEESADDDTEEADSADEGDDAMEDGDAMADGGGVVTDGQIDIDKILATDLSSCAEAPSGDAIKVGMAMDFSDVVGFVDIPGSMLVPHLADLINCAGGVNGSPVEVQVAEVGDDAALATQDLLDFGAHFMVGPPFADFALPILQETQGQVPLFVAASTEPTLADSSINSYLVTFDDNQMSAAVANWALANDITRAIVFTEGEGVPYSGVNPDAFIAAFEAGGGEVVSTQTYVWAADTDFSAQVNEIAGISENNEIVFSAALSFQVTALRGQLEGQGLDGLTYAGTDALDATGIQDPEAAGGDNEGVVHTPHTTVTDERIQAMFASYEGAGNDPLESQGFMALYADSLFLGLQGIVDCGCAEPADIGTAVQAIDGFPGLSGEITYAGTTGIPPKAVPIHQIVDGVDTRIDTQGG
ncbi:MAG: ABC transporter substrate-binding protein [Actinomycetota bacterium]